MESPESWDALTARLACADLDDPARAFEALSCAGLVVTMTAAQRAAVEEAIRLEGARELTGPSPAARAAGRIRDAGLASGAADDPDPRAHRANRDALAFATNACRRACVSCGLLSIEWWRDGRCRCGATRVVPPPDATVQPCPACEGRSPVGAVYCEACGRPFAPAVLGHQTRVEVLEEGVVARVFLIDKAFFTIGRDPGNDVALTWITIARRHVGVTFEDARWTIEDLGSPGGTYMNGAQVKGRVSIREDQLFELHPLRIRLKHVDRAKIVCDAIAEESMLWTAPAIQAASVQHYAARLCDGLELAVGRSFGEAQTLMTATEALLAVLLDSPPDVAIGGLGAAVRARLLHAISGTQQATRASLGRHFDDHDAWRRLAVLQEHVERMPERRPPLTAAEVLARVEQEASAWSLESTRICEAWQNLSEDDFAAWQANGRWLARFLTDLRVQAGVVPADAHDALETVEQVATVVLVDPADPPPEIARTRLSGCVGRLRLLLGPRR